MVLHGLAEIPLISSDHLSCIYNDWWKRASLHKMIQFVDVTFMSLPISYHILDRCVRKRSSGQLCNMFINLTISCRFPLTKTSSKELEYFCKTNFMKIFGYTGTEEMVKITPGQHNIMLYIHSFTEFNANNALNTTGPAKSSHNAISRIKLNYLSTN